MLQEEIFKIALSKPTSRGTTKPLPFQAL